MCLLRVKCEELRIGILTFVPIILGGTSKRHLDASGPSGSKGTEKAEYEATPPKRTKASETKDVQDIEGSRIQFKKLEQQVLQQAYQQKMDAFK